jgi:hypothetical protein
MNADRHSIKLHNGVPVNNIIVKFREHPEAGIAIEKKESISKSEYDKNCDKILKLFPRSIVKRLFTSLPDEKLFKLMNKAKLSDKFYKPIDLFSYYSVESPLDCDPDEIIGLFADIKGIELSYIQGTRINTSLNMGKQPVISYQNYLYPAPEGIDSCYAWKIKGGKGKGKVRFIDVEQGWNPTHKWLDIQTLPLSGISKDSFGEHGSSVMSVIKTKEGSSFGKGIVPEAKGYIISQWRPDGSLNEPDAILSAISYLNFGDILLLESQSYHPDTQNKLWPVEIQDANFQVIRLATALGIIVIEAAGNGDPYGRAGNNLDLFTSNGKRVLYPFGNDFRDSGALIVAAASPFSPHQPGMYSNFGERINCYASGEASADLSTGKLTGTSSASAIIAGAAIAIQSISETNFNTRIGPAEMRSVVGSDIYGTPSAQGKKQDKIGVMPDLKKIIEIYFKLARV